MSDKPTYEQLQQKILALEATLSRHSKREVRYTALFQNLSHEVHIWELVRDASAKIKTWRLLDANPAALSSWGRDLSDVVGKTTDEIFPDSGTTETFMPVVEKVFAEQKTHHWEQHFEGINQTLAMTSIPCEDYFICIGVDITHTRQTEKELNNAIQTLDESIRSGRIGMWNWDLVTNDVYFSKEYKKQLGYQDHEMANDYLEWEKRVHPDDVEASLRSIRTSLETDAKVHENQFRIRHKNGSYRWILAQASIFRDEHGKAIRMLGSHIDITERKKLEEELSHSQKMEAIGHLAGGVAHDFNNQLASILGFTEMLGSGMHDPKQKEYLDKIISAVEHSQRITQQLLVFSRKSELSLRSLDVHQQIHEVVEILKHSIDKRIELRIDLQAEAHNTIGDKTLIQNALLNLGLNARDAMPNGGTLTITTTHSSLPANIPLAQRPKPSPAGFIRIDFKDTGEGIEESDKSKIFEPFYTTKTPGTGTGLGLASVNSTVNQLGGYVEFESKLGSGTNFILYLPLSEPQGADETPDTAADTPKGNGAHALNILLADDEPFIREICEAYLRNMGHRGVFVADGLEAVKFFRHNGQDIDLVILDMVMPVMNGNEAFHAMKHIQPDVKVIISSGYIADNSAEALLQDGVKAIIEKPYKLAELKQVIDRVMHMP